MNLQKQFPHKQLHKTSDYITESRYTFNEYIKELEKMYPNGEIDLQTGTVTFQSPE